MGNLFIVANWKSNKTANEAKLYLDDFVRVYRPRTDVTAIICPSDSALEEVANHIKNSGANISVGVQNISEHDEGAFTGELSAKQAVEFAKYAIIGHSERRKMGETDEAIKNKVEMAIKNGMEPILCVVNESVPIPVGVKITAYEPIEAIGTGNPDTPENAEKIASLIKEKNKGVENVLYGGSVTSENVKGFTSMQNINGVLVGGASLDPHSFSEIINNA